MDFVVIAHLPMVALEVIKTVPIGNNLAELLSNPFFVIFLSVFSIRLVCNSVISDGNAHNISPFQYSRFVESGVPPPINSPIPSNLSNLPFFWNLDLLSK